MLSPLRLHCSGRGSPRVNDKEPRDTIVTDFWFFKEYSSYKPEMDWAPTVKGVTRYQSAELDEPIYDSHRRSFAPRFFFVRGCNLAVTEIMQRLGNTPKINRSVEEIDKNQQAFPNGATREREQSWSSHI